MAAMDELDDEDEYLFSLATLLNFFDIALYLLL